METKSYFKFEKKTIGPKIGSGDTKPCLLFLMTIFIARRWVALVCRGSVDGDDAHVEQAQRHCINFN